MNFFKKSDPVEPKADAAPMNAAFPDIGETQDPGLEPTNAPAGPATVESLSKQFDEYKADADARETRLLDALASATATPVPVAAPAAAAEVKDFEPTALPDSVEDPEGYARVVQENATGAVQHMMDSQAAETNRNAAGGNAYEGMWDKFQAKYEDLAKHEELVEIHAGRVAKTLSSQGVDVQTYMVQNQDRFLEDVAKSVGERLTALGMAPKEDGGQRPDPMLDPNRTGGLPGAVAASEPAKDTGAPKQGGFISEIHESQKAMGLI